MTRSLLPENATLTPDARKEGAARGRVRNLDMLTTDRMRVVAGHVASIDHVSRACSASRHLANPTGHG
jgi:hypothetical protein